MRILRFFLGTRLLHWSHALSFIFLLISGIALFFTQASLLGNPLLKMAHLYASLPFILLPCLVYALSKSAREDIEELSKWSRDDLMWFMEFLKKKAYFKGKFNAGQKMNFVFSLLLMIGLSLTGFVVWMKSMFSVSFVELNFVIHDYLAVLAILLLIGHVVFTLYYRESLRGIIFGVVEGNWAKRHYPDWYRKIYLGRE